KRTRRRQWRRRAEPASPATGKGSAACENNKTNTVPLPMANRALPINGLGPALDQLYQSYNYADSAADPIQIVRRFDRADDREVVGFCAAALAFGRVASVLQSIERVLAVMGDHPARYVLTFDPRRDAGKFHHIVHRWIRPSDIVALVWLMKQMTDEAETIEGF